MFTKEELDYIDRNLEINYREDHVDKDESSYYSIKVKLANLINKPVETTNEQPNLLKLYEKFRDSDILEGLDEGIILAFLYYVKKGNLEGKSFNPNYYKNTEKDVLNCRIKDLEKLYNITIIKNEG